MLLQFAAQQGLTDQMRTAIKSHRDTWVTEADFSFMASLGVNAVRLPVGYWVLAQTQVGIMRFRCSPPCLSHALHVLRWCYMTKLNLPPSGRAGCMNKH